MFVVILQHNFIEAIHNKDDSVVKTSKAGLTRPRLFCFLPNECQQKKVLIHHQHLFRIYCRGEL